jgi:hypothetical protein
MGISLLVRFLEQGKGRLSKRALNNEFSVLTVAEASEIENNFSLIFEIE